MSNVDLTEGTRLYYREVSRREAINRFGKLGYVPYVEFCITDDPATINYRKRIKFSEYRSNLGWNVNAFIFLKCLVNQGQVFGYKFKDVCADTVDGEFTAEELEALCRLGWIDMRYWIENEVIDYGESN